MGVLFNIYLESSLLEFSDTVDAIDIRSEHNYAIMQDTMLPEEDTYADDSDFITEDELRKNIVVAVDADTLLVSNFLRMIIMDPFQFFSALTPSPRSGIHFFDGSSHPEENFFRNSPPRGDFMLRTRYF